jgi:hypothetical protein
MCNSPISILDGVGDRRDKDEFSCDRAKNLKKRTDELGPFMDLKSLWAFTLSLGDFGPLLAERRARGFR